MHLSITRGGELIFDSFSTTWSEIYSEHGDVKLRFDKITPDRVQTDPCQVSLRLYRDEFTQVGRLHRARETLKRELGTVRTAGKVAIFSFQKPRLQE